MENHQIIKDRLKQKLKFNLGETIQSSIKLLNPSSEVYDEMILHLSKYNQLEKETRLGTIADSNKETSYNKLRYSILKSINSISFSNLFSDSDVQIKFDTSNIQGINSLNDYFNFETDWMLENDGEGPVRNKIIQKKCKIISSGNKVRFFLDEIIKFSFDYPNDWKIEEPEEYQPFDSIFHDFIEIEFTVDTIKNIRIVEKDTEKKHSPKLTYLVFESYEAGQINICISNIMNRSKYFNAKGKLTKIEYDDNEGVVRRTRSHEYSLYLPFQNSKLVIDKLKMCLKIKPVPNNV